MIQARWPANGLKDINGWQTPWFLQPKYRDQDVCAGWSVVQDCMTETQKLAQSLGNDDLDMLDRAFCLSISKLHSSTVFASGTFCRPRKCFGQLAPRDVGVEPHAKVGSLDIGDDGPGPVPGAEMGAEAQTFLHAKQSEQQAPRGDPIRPLAGPAR